MFKNSFLTKKVCPIVRPMAMTGLAFLFGMFISAP